MEPWTSFHAFVKTGLEKLERRLNMEDATFPSAEGWKGLAATLTRDARNEGDVTQYLAESLENLVRFTYGKLDIELVWKLQDKINTAKQVNSDFSARYDAETARGGASVEPRMTPSKRVTWRRIDKMCNAVLDGRETAVLAFEIKAGNVVTLKLWLQGLRAMKVDDVTEYMVRLSTDKRQAKQQRAELNIAQAMSRLFTYMLEKKVRYGIMASGVATVFVYFDDATRTCCIFTSPTRKLQMHPRGSSPTSQRWE